MCLWSDILLISICKRSDIWVFVWWDKINIGLFVHEEINNIESETNNKRFNNIERISKKKKKKL